MLSLRPAYSSPRLPPVLLPLPPMSEGDEAEGFLLDTQLLMVGEAEDASEGDEGDGEGGLREIGGS